jgi:hypothetical protein
MIFGEYRRSGALGQVQAGATDELPGVGFLDAKDTRDVTIGVVEGLPKNVRRAFCRR